MCDEELRCAERFIEQCFPDCCFSGTFSADYERTAMTANSVPRRRREEIALIEVALGFRASELINTGEVNRHCAYTLKRRFDASDSIRPPGTSAAARPAE